MPRSVCVDFDPRSIHDISGSHLGNLFNPDNLICNENGQGMKGYMWSDMIGSQNNYATGFFTEGAEICDEIMDQIRRECERCDCLQGIQFVHALAGGTGSGLGTLLTNQVTDREPCELLSSNFNRILW